MDKFLTVELMICWMDNTWTTDYVWIPYPTDDEKPEEILTEAIKLWEAAEEAVIDQRGSVGPVVAKICLYNVNWDEPTDKDGNRIEG